MCLPNVTEHIEAGLRRRDFLKHAGSAAAAGLFGGGEVLAAPHFHDPDLDLEFAARMEGSAIAFTLTLHNPHREGDRTHPAGRSHPRRNDLHPGHRRSTAQSGTDRRQRGDLGIAARGPGVECGSVLL